MSEAKQSLRRRMINTCPARTEAVTKDEWIQLIKEGSAEPPAFDQFDEILEELISRGAVLRLGDDRYYDPNSTTNFQVRE